MSLHSVPKPEHFDVKNLSRILLILLGIGGLSLLITLIVGFIAPPGSELRRQFAFSWLFAFVYFFTVLAGCYFWILVHHSTDSGWGILVRRQMENLAVLLPWMVLFFVPLFLFRKDIWAWITVKNQVHVDPALEAKLRYFEFRFGHLVVPFFWLRTICYFLYFGLAAFYFRRASLRQDGDGDPRWSIQMRGASFVCLLLFAVSLTALSFDWLAALDSAPLSTCARPTTPTHARSRPSHWRYRAPATRSAAPAPRCSRAGSPRARGATEQRGSPPGAPASSRSRCWPRSRARSCWRVRCAAPNRWRSLASSRQAPSSARYPAPPPRASAVRGRPRHPAPSPGPSAPRSRERASP
jgi:hypothetical protein